MTRRRGDAGTRGKAAGKSPRLAQLVALASLALIFVTTATASAQLAPGIGYVHPAGGQAGASVDVVLGGYDWTPDLQFFVLDPRVKLEILGPPGEVIVPPPPYWFGPKGRGAAAPMPREVPARITIPTDVPPGPISWQVANANGASARGTFIVGTQNEAVEQRRRNQPQRISHLPATISGRLEKIEEVDRYEFLAEHSGPISCQVVARGLGTPINAILQVRDAGGRLIADVADTEGVDTALTFAAQAGGVYTVSVHDLDFRGDRAYVYRLEINPGPRVIAALPAAGRRAQTQRVKFVGYGVATGAAILESVSRDVAFPEQPNAPSLEYRLETPFGIAAPFKLPLSDIEEIVELTLRNDPAKHLSAPAAVTGTLEPGVEDDRYHLDGRKDDLWLLSLGSCAIGNTFDPLLVIYGPDGKEVARNDDAASTRDSGLSFKVPADGAYQVAVSALSGGARGVPCIYRLAVAKPRPDFSISCPDRTSLLVGTKVGELPVTATRIGGFDGPIALAVSGLPDGVTTSGELLIPPDKTELKIPLTSAADAPAVAALVKIVAKAKVGDVELTREAGPLLFASTMKPRAKVTPVDKDGGRTVHRGTTFPAPVIVERLEGFDGDVVLEMTSQQSRHRQGIRGPEITMPPGVTRAEYPCFMPEWLETSRTSRMILNAVTKVPDARGNMRYLVNLMDGRITMSMEGALLKLSYNATELRVRPGEAFEIPLTISRSAKLPDLVRVELRLDAELEGILHAEPLVVPAASDQAILRVQSADDQRLAGEIELTIRATAMERGNLPVISETAATVEFVTAK
ncbi:MAG: hypothetical protein WD648_11155 [Planctomycetaceae bacterium]